MYIIAVIFIFLLGLVLGSFVNALQYRIAESMTMGGRSLCPNCKHQLSALDLVPVFSWILLGGKCRYCKKPIAIQYPLVEILSGLSLIFLATEFGLLLPFLTTGSLLATSWLLYALQFIAVTGISTILILLALHDYKTGFVLSTYAYVAVGLVALMASFPTTSFIGWAALLPYVYASIGAAVPFALLWAISRGRWMGAGDIELALLVGLLLGWPRVIIGLYFAFIVGSIVGVALIANKKSKMKSEIAFGPFLIAGIYFALAFGQQIIDIYVRIFLG